jgi:hypothetical protein
VHDSSCIAVPDGGPTPLDRLFDALCHPLRRRVLLLVAEEAPVSVARLVAECPGSESRLALRHLHLPKLSGMGYLEWDRDAGTVRRGTNFEEVARMLRLLTDHEDELPGRWP